MAWVGQYGLGATDAGDNHDVLLSVSDEGELAFWIPESGITPQVNGSNKQPVNGVGKRHSPWTCTGRVRTGRKGLTTACCSSAKKSVLGAFGLP